jgi:UDP-2,4-diacetamido-2,4,6-trideoxy-beta-L-altropyranose hydrolase
LKVAIRADASVELGTGHVVRCLTLARALREKCDAEVSFICRPATGDQRERIAEAGFAIAALTGTPSEDADETAAILDSMPPRDWLVVDHYRLGREWEATVRGIRRIMAIDDLTDRPHDCDLLLNQTPVPELAERCRAQVPSHCRLLAGPAYALLDPAFAHAHRQWRAPSGTVGRLLVSFGGTDPPDMTGRALRALAALAAPALEVEVTAGTGMPQRERLQSLVADLPHARLHVGVAQMAVLMAGADLAIGACGMTAMERCAFGLPALVISIADNQVEIARALALRGAVEYLGTAPEVTEDLVRDAVSRALHSPERVLRMALAAHGVTDGQGTARVCEALAGAWA